MGASLANTWLTGRETNLEDFEEHIQYSDNPLATGLLDIDIHDTEWIGWLFHHITTVQTLSNNIDTEIGPMR